MTFGRGISGVSCITSAEVRAGRTVAEFFADLMEVGAFVGFVGCPPPRSARYYELKEWKNVLGGYLQNRQKVAKHSLREDARVDVVSNRPSAARFDAPLHQPA